MERMTRCALAARQPSPEPSMHFLLDEGIVE